MFKYTHIKHDLATFLYACQLHGQGKKPRKQLHILIASISLRLCCCCNGYFGSQYLSIVSSHCHHVSTKQQTATVVNLLSVMHWTKQPCDCLIADVEKQGINQKLAATAMKTVLWGVSSAFNTEHTLHYKFTNI